VLIAGLLVGIFMPELALLLRPAIAPMIVMLLFLAVLRLGPPGIAAGVSALRRAAVIALLLQLVLPLVAVALFVAFGVLAHPLATGAVLALAAAPITGSPNITLMVGGDPAAALRQLVVGTALLPLTALPVFFAMPTFGSPLAVALASITLLALITVTGGAALLLRRSGIVPATDRSFAIMDGVAALLLGSVVIGLMSAVGPALFGHPSEFVLALAAAFALNLPIQLLAASRTAKGDPRAAPAIGIVAGNRNIALFLSVLPQTTADQLLLFIGCYQIPMYLTPVLLSGFYRRLGRL
jgi:arsenite transporter